MGSSWDGPSFGIGMARFIFLSQFAKIAHKVVLLKMKWNFRWEESYQRGKDRPITCAIKTYQNFKYHFKNLLMTVPEISQAFSKCYWLIVMEMFCHITGICVINHASLFSAMFLWIFKVLVFLFLTTINSPNLYTTWLIYALPKANYKIKNHPEFPFTIYYYKLKL